MTNPAHGEHDPITAEIIRNALIAITDEMKTNLMRTAYNPIIYEALDYTVGLFDANGDTVSIGLGLPMFIRGLSDAIKAKLEFYGPGGIEPGDILFYGPGGDEHEAMYVGGGSMIEAPYTGASVWITGVRTDGLAGVGRVS